MLKMKIFFLTIHILILMHYIQHFHLITNIIEKLPTKQKVKCLMLCKYWYQHCLVLISDIKLPPVYDTNVVSSIQKFKNVSLTIVNTPLYLKHDHLYKSITRLDIINFDFSLIPWCINDLYTIIPRLEELKELRLIRNMLTNIPDTFSQLKNLEELNISSNMIKELPDSFIHLEKLTCLNIANNRFKKIPHCVFKFSNLKFLNISGNFINDLTSSIVQLKSLITLNIANNRIHDITIVENMTNLENVFVAGGYNYSFYENSCIREKLKIYNFFSVVQYKFA